MLRIGYTVPKNPSGQTLPKYLETCSQSGLQAFQIFLTANQNWSKGKSFSAGETAQIRDIISKNGMYGVVHGKYLYNFCRQHCQSQVESLIHELELANEIGCDVILHQGKNVAEEKLSRLEAINNYVKHISEALEKTDKYTTGIVLENSAHQGNEIGHSLDELAYIYNQFDDSLKPRIGFCLDLCHAFVAGELDVRKRDAVVQYFEAFDQKLGLDKLSCVHYNDSDVLYQGCNDHHGDIGCGYITNTELGGSIDGMRCMAEMCLKYNIPVIFETPCSLRTIHNQFAWQAQIVNDWSQGSNLVYQKYLETYHVDIISAEIKSMKGRPKSKAKSKTDSPGSGAGALTEVALPPPKPKIKLVLKTQPQNQPKNT